MSHQLPQLAYAYDALEPHLDALTMEIHHSRHHQTYVNNLNAALKDNQYATWPLEKLLRQIKQLPDNLQAIVRDHGGGHANHSLFWQVMSPNGGAEPSGQLAQAIIQTFGSFAEFKQRFTQAAVSRFGSGWAWLTLDSSGNLRVENSVNQDSPLMHGHTPILALDVWEHAYYLKYQNKRPEYIDAFYQVINWGKVEQLYLEHLAS
ncbi:superoxide dismutase [Shewanella baltica]|uniref:Superoxide dismutase n=1 Tax=Shewanella scandinavica TaxID=3063538 RepID=A0ABU3G011_9GAMM|nr:MULTISPECIES: superoxide dismutase [Shewanella]KZK70440.1 superoxide dismutase [Shewanella baltica]MDT3279897.1 superoxide dismutase [Shewanella sp. SP2S1-2]